MKPYSIKFLIAGILFLSLYSCLDLDPQDQLGDGNMWQSTQDFEQFSNKFYEWTRDFPTAVFDAPHCDKRSDLITYTSPNPYSSGINTIPTSDGNYTDNYNRIRRTNMLLKHAGEYPQPTDIERYVGVAHFFRAYCYFDLVQLYGDVIWTDKVLDLSDPEMLQKRDDRGVVIDHIISDLNEAGEELPYYVNLTSTETGYLSKEAAWGFLSRVALYEGTWQKSRGNEVRGKELLDIAAKAARKVIDTGTFHLFGDQKDPSSNGVSLGDAAQRYMFILENEKSNPEGIQKSANQEYILSRRHDQTLSPIGWSITKECLSNVQWVTRKFANLYLCQDGLPIEKSSLFQKYGTKTSEFINRDNRMRNTLLEPGIRFWSNETASCRMTWDDSDLERAMSYDPKGGTCYNHQKWCAERNVPSAQEGYDYPVIRYAEVLLNYAEALFERDDAISDDDLNLSLNRVRLRINKDMPALINSFVTAHNLDMRTEIRRERTVELFNEGFRIDDLKRWKIAEIEMPQDMLGIKKTGTAYDRENLSYSLNSEGCIIVETGRKWESKHYLYPLPLDQLQLNPNLGQNPGWR
ncbi:RagB/SusD family nutrient uptake outer membrane protein [Bacteroides finegoldii]|uniref:RagB/SusD family nutrient uptake outer membrane protein n=1 Tax=Bacteroides finegoldii TaxID=338188 RepID=UPI00189F1995|nr:RagB/SusD family nutrient uptake outer membrane protein [Bacteroides finegoldii]